MTDKSGELIKIYRFKNNSIDLALPVRFTSLIQNSKLDIVPATVADKRKEAMVAEITIRLQVEDLPPSFSEKLKQTFKTSDTLWSVLLHFETVSGINFTQRSVTHKTSESSGYVAYEKPVLQSFSVQVNTMEEYKKTLKELGLNSKTETLRVRFEKTSWPFQDVLAKNELTFGPSPVIKRVNDYNELFADSSADLSEPIKSPKNLNERNENIEKETEIDETHSESDRMSVSEPDATMNSQFEQLAVPESQPEVKEEARKIKVYLPSDTPRTIQDEDDSVYDVSLTDVQRLREQIQSVSKTGPMLTKNLRSQMEKQKYEQQQSSILQVRIKFPDQTTIDVEHKASDNIDQVYDTVRSVLRNPDLPFVLFVNPPKQIFKDRSKLLGLDLKFGPRTLLFMEWDRDFDLKFPSNNILNPEIMKTGIEFTEAPDVKLDTAKEEVSESNASAVKRKSTGSSWLSKGKGPLSQQHKNKLMKFIKTSK